MLSLRRLHHVSSHILFCLVLCRTRVEAANRRLEEARRAGNGIGIADTAEAPDTGDRWGTDLCACRPGGTVKRHNSGSSSALLGCKGSQGRGLRMQHQL